MSFVVDKAGNTDVLSNIKRNVNELRAKNKNSVWIADHMNASCEEDCEEDGDSENDSEYDVDYFGLPPPNVDLSEIINSALQLTDPPKTKEELELQRMRDLVDAAAANANAESHRRPKNRRIVDLDFSDFNELTGKFDDEQSDRTNVTKLLADSKMGPGFEQLKSVPEPTPKKLKKINKDKRSQTKGAGWYNLPATEITESVQNDLKILQMRSVLDPKRFYKKNDLKVLPKYFQIGTVQHSPLDFYNDRNTRRNKRKSMVDELLVDPDAQKFTKRKYNEIVATREKYAHRKAQKKMKKLKKNK